MKKVNFKRTIALTIVLAGFLGFGTAVARADFEVSAGIQINAPADFYDPLAANGTWVDVSSFGRCWHPAGVDAEWRPYCEGSWVSTDAGWYWQSEEPWAWACYHYGSWMLETGVGWVWIPGTQWAPAWVNWREGGGHIGWAPCGPRGAAAADASFVFVDENHFQGEHRRSDVVVNNTTYLHETKAINSNNQRESRTIDGRQQTVMVNNGPDMNNIEKASGHKVQSVPIRDAASHTASPGSAGHPSSMPAKNRNGNETMPPATPDRRTPSTAPSEFPNQSTPTEKSFPEDREVIPRGAQSGAEVPVPPQAPRPQPGSDGTPSIPRSVATPTIPQQEATPTLPQQEGTPTLPQPEGVPSVPPAATVPATHQAAQPDEPQIHEAQPHEPQIHEAQPHTPQLHETPPPAKSSTQKPPQQEQQQQNDNKGKDNVGHQ